MRFSNVTGYIKNNKLVAVILLLPILIWFSPFRFWYILPFTMMGALIGMILSSGSCFGNHGDLCGFGETMYAILVLYVIAFALPYFISMALFLKKCKSKPLKEKIFVLLIMLLIYLVVLTLVFFRSSIFNKL